VPCCQCVLERDQQHEGSRKLLAERVVKVAAEPQLLAARRLEHRGVDPELAHDGAGRADQRDGAARIGGTKLSQ
jgi:hypothetical protein